jgi:ABC-2 type transport system ATP-binding protein
VTPPALVFEGASFAYRGGPPVVEGLDCALAGGVLGVLGNNGVGKSTVLKLAAGLTEPDRGTVRVRGVDTRRGAARGLTAFLPESLEVDGKLTPGEFLKFVAEVRGVPDPSGAANRLLERLGAAAEADRLMRELSFGARRKVGLAAALMGDTPLVVLDEPGTGLDVASLDRLEGLIAERVGQGATVVLSAHDMGFVARTCDHLVVLLGGGRARAVEPDVLLRETGAPDLHHAFRTVTGSGAEAPA